MAWLSKILGELAISTELLAKYRNGCFFYPVQDSNLSVRRYAAKTGGKDPPRIESLDGVKMPGFIPPDRIREEGYFTQKAREELEKFKRKMDKDKLGPPKNEET